MPQKRPLDLMLKDDHLDDSMIRKMAKVLDKVEDALTPQKIASKEWMHDDPHSVSACSSDCAKIGPKYGNPVY